MAPPSAEPIDDQVGVGNGQGGSTQVDHRHCRVAAVNPNHGSDCSRDHGGGSIYGGCDLSSSYGLTILSDGQDCSGSSISGDGTIEGNLVDSWLKDNEASGARLMPNSAASLDSGRAEQNGVVHVYNLGRYVDRVDHGISSL